MKLTVLFLFLLGSALAFGQAAREIGVSVHEYKDASTPANPPAGYYKVYVKSGSLYILNSAGTETEIGSGGGTGAGISEWATGQSYQAGDLVHESNLIYIALNPHTSGTFATDLSGGEWQLLHDDAAVTQALTNKTFDADGTGNSITNIENADIKAAAAIDATKIADGSVSNAEFQALDGGIANADVAAAAAIDATKIADGSVSSAEFQTLDGGIALGGAEVTGVLGLAKGGTAKDLSSGVAQSKVLYTDTDSVELSATGTEGQELRLNSSGAPVWADVITKIWNKPDVAGMTSFSSVSFPNKSVTNYAGTAYVDTGNKNLLSNSSFEMTDLTGWTQTGTTGTADVTVTDGEFVDGMSGYECAIGSSQACVLKQSSTLYAASFADGVQGLASMWVKTDASTCTLCAVQAGTPSTTDCVTINSDNKWGLYKVPFVLGATSNGLELNCGSTSSKTVYADAAYVGAPDIIQDSAAVGPWITYTPTGGWTGNTTYAGRYRQVGDSLEFQVFISISVGAPTPAATALQLNMPSGYTVNESKLASSTNGTLIALGLARFYDFDTAGNRATGLVAYGGANLVRVQTAGGGTVTNTNPFTFASGDSVALTFTVPINELNGNVNTYTAQCGANCENTLSAYVTSAGVVSTEGGGDWINGNCSLATATFTCPFKTGIFTVAPACHASSTTAGSGTSFYVANFEGAVSTSQAIVETQTASVDDAAGFYITCSKQGADYKNTRTIVGSFKDHVTSKGTGNLNVQYGRVRCAGAGTASILQDTGGWMASISAVSGGACTVTLNSGVFSSTPTCFGGISDAALGVGDGSILGVAGISSTSFTSDCEMDDATACTDYYYGVVCWETY
jgi:hypothetical protein